MTFCFAILADRSQSVLANYATQLSVAIHHDIFLPVVIKYLVYLGLKAA